MTGEEALGGVAVIVVNWNTRGLLRGCLAALAADGGSASHHVICIDNASSDGSAEMVMREFPSVLLLCNRTNLGFAAAVNQGIACAMERYQPAYLSLVNSDAVVSASTLVSLAAELQQRRGAAAIAPALRLPDGRLQKGSGGFAPTAWSGVCHFLFLSALTRGRCRGVFIDQQHYAGRRGPVAVDWVSGACVVVRADAVRRVGSLDETFFMYGEDVDWFCRMRGAGFSVLYFPALECLHQHGASSPRADPGWIRSLLHLVRRDRGAFESAVFRGAAAAGLALRAVLYTLAYRLRGDDRHRRLAGEMASYARWTVGL